MKCKHYRDDAGCYEYSINDEEVINLCEQCHVNLASTIMVQLVVEVFAESMKRSKDKVK